MAKKQKISQSVPLVAIDLGSHGVRAMAANMTDEGLLHVLGVETSSKFQCVKKGIVEKPTDAGYMINEALKLLSNRIGVKDLPSAFACVGGRTMQIVPIGTKRDQIRKREITQYLLDDMEKECKQKIEAHYPNVAVLDMVPYYYKLDGVEQEDCPLNQQAIIVEANFIAFVGKMELEQKVIDSFNRSGKRLEHMFVRPDCLMSALASDEDMRDGCVVLDLGAQTTTLTAYKGTQYLYNKVVSMGGYDITRDIEQIGISMPYAEQLKCLYGYASSEYVETNQRYRVPAPEQQEGHVTLTTSELADLISARLEQFIPALLEQINQEAYRYKVLYVTGAGAMLQGVVEYVQSLTSILVMYGSHASWLTADTSDEMCMPAYSSLVGTLLLGAAYRETHPLMKTNTWRVFDIITSKTLEMFTDQPEPVRGTIETTLEEEPDTDGNNEPNV